eukprot:1142714-Pelagomonas_calceolata.AAC.3
MALSPQTLPTMHSHTPLTMTVCMLPLCSPTPDHCGMPEALLQRLAAEGVLIFEAPKEELWRGHRQEAMVRRKHEMMQGQCRCVARWRAWLWAAQQCCAVCSAEQSACVRRWAGWLLWVGGGGEWEIGALAVCRLHAVGGKRE